MIATKAVPQTTSEKKSAQAVGLGALNVQQARLPRAIRKGVQAPWWYRVPIMFASPATHCALPALTGVTASTSDLDLLNGLEVRMPSSCSKCGCVTALIQTEANRRSLRCASCRAHLGWVSSLTERFLQKIVERFGRPTKPIQVHHNSLIELSPPPSGAGGTTSIRAPRYMEK